MKLRCARSTWIVLIILSLLISIYGTTPVQAAILSSAFIHRGQFPVGANALALASADLDGDGKLDLMTTNYISDRPSILTVLRNTSTAVNSITFDPVITFTTDSYPYSVIPADFDGDGRPDVVTVHDNPAGVTVMRNTTTNGSISFADPVLVPINAILSGAFVDVADMNQDGKLDIIISRQAEENFYVLLNASTGAGSIAFSLLAFPFANFFYGSGVVADVDGDLLPDLITVQGAYQLAIYQNTSANGVLAFSAEPVVYSVGIQYQPYAADLDGDGKVDLALLCRYRVFPDANEATLRVMRNTSTGPGMISFANGGEFSLFSKDSMENFQLEMSDLDLDGKPDLALMMTYENAVVVFGNASSGPGSIAFAAPQSFALQGFIHTAIIAADLDGDYLPDLQVANQNSNDIEILRNQIDPAPVCQPLNLSTGRNAANATAPNCLDRGSASAALTYQIADNGDHGTAAFTVDGRLEYVPTAGFTGTDSFTYTAFDGLTYSAPATVSVTVTNTVPQAAADAYRTKAGQTLTVDAVHGVLPNDSDGNGDPLTAHLVVAPAHGQFTLQADGSFTYIPAPGFFGEDLFTYTASDGVDESSGTRVTIKVDPFVIFLPDVRRGQ